MNGYIKLEPGVHARLKEVARREKRSLSGQIIYYVERMVEAERAAEQDPQQAG
jgi:macrodomain Ter protein organizer (MatP/YcbG family)